MGCMLEAPLAHMGHASQHMHTHHTQALTCPIPRTPYKPTLPPPGRTPGPAHPYTHAGLLESAFRTGWVQVPHMGVSSRLVATYPSPKHVRMTTPTHTLRTPNATHASMM